MSIPSPSMHLKRPKVYTLQPGKRLVRFYNPRRQNWNTGRFFGPLTKQRFDHHPLPEGDSDPESVWYASGKLMGAVAESFGRDNMLDRNSSRRICMVELSKAFKVVDLFGYGPRRLGLDQQICTTAKYKITQQWARALYRQFTDIVGIHWRGRQVALENIVLTDRADLTTLILVSDHDISEDAAWPRIANAARKCEIKIV